MLESQDAEEKERGCEEDEQRWQRDRTEEAWGTSAREAGVFVLLAEMVKKNETMVPKIHKLYI